MRIVATADRVMETADFEGAVGSLVVTGAMTGYRTFADAGLSMGKIFPLVIEGIDGACFGQVWWGWGEFDATGVALRYTSDGDISLYGMTFLAGPKRVFCSTNEMFHLTQAPVHRALMRLGLTHQIKASCSTINATPQVMQGYSGIHLVDVTLSADATIRVLDNTLITFTVTASADSGYAAAWECKALINYSGVSPVIVGTESITLIAADAGMAGTGVSIAFGTNPDSSDALQVIVTGLAAEAIEWTLVGTRVAPGESDPVGTEYGYPENFADY